MTIAEFPTTREAARSSRDGGLAVLVGAPNLVLGGSHSGNIAAIDLLRDGQADILSSDYVPASLMESIFKLPAAAMAKTVLYKAVWAEREEVVAVLMRGDLEINEVKLTNALGALSVKLADEDAIKAAIADYRAKTGKKDDTGQAAE